MLRNLTAAAPPSPVAQDAIAPEVGPPRPQPDARVTRSGNVSPAAAAQAKEDSVAKVSSAVDRVSYEDLYTRWEKGNWRAMEIDFSEDRQEWHEKWSEKQRKAALWNYSLFFHGEDSVTDNLSPYIDAAPLEEQKYFLATQQVDEARHAVFFGRFMREVVDRGDDSYASALAATEGELTWGFRKTFERLDRVADSLRRDKSKPNLAAAIVMYHILVEATFRDPASTWWCREFSGRLTEVKGM